MPLTRVSFLGAASMLLLTASATARANPPAPVSPGETNQLVTISDRCPTFSWSGASGSGSVELVVYRIGDRGSEMEVALQKRLPASTYAWTPALDRCLERGGRYAWSVRSVGEKGDGDWSSPSLFRVAAGQTEAELERALEVVRSYLAGRGQAGPPPSRTSLAASDSPASGSSAGSRTPSSEAVSTGTARAGPAKGDGVEIADDHISIGGDNVVTTATDSDTLGGLLCTGSQVPRRHSVSGDWFCGTDRLDGIVCPEGQIVRRIGGTWGCDLDRWTGYEVVQGADVTCGPLSFCTASVECPGIKVVLGGGAGSIQDGLRMVSSFPVPLTRTWHVAMHNAVLTASRVFTPYAVCSGGTGGF